MKVQVSPSTSDLLVSVGGHFSLKHAYSTLERVGREARRTDIQRIKMDVREMSGAMSRADRFELAEHVVKHLGLQIRLALLVRHDMIADRVFENVAFNRGMQILVSSSEAEVDEFLAE